MRLALFVGVLIGAAPRCWSRTRASTPFSERRPRSWRRRWTRGPGRVRRDHSWIKISTAEIVAVGTACKIAFPEVGWFVCPPTSAAINAALRDNPHVRGVWGELYTDGRVRVGTW
ncbi:hypothetical protein [Kutzneria sp. NPDC051319]|uniref:hypothetical protein n=1 Tax=Kutzneria sp. NPDC051319 TaxID=3155047 RepID=UPI00343055F7